MNHSATDLKFGTIGRRELLTFKNPIKFTKVAGMHSGDCLGLDDAFILMQVLTCRQ